MKLKNILIVSGLAIVALSACNKTKSTKEKVKAAAEVVGEKANETVTDVKKAIADPGLITLNSTLSHDKLVEKAEGLFEAKGLKLFSKIEHHKGAESIGEELNPTTLLIFGNPKIGTAFMQEDQLFGYTLPMKYLIWEDDEGNAHLSYMPVNVMTEEYGITKNETVDSNIAKLANKIIDNTIPTE